MTTPDDFEPWDALLEAVNNRDEERAKALVLEDRGLLERDDLCEVLVLARETEQMALAGWFREHGATLLGGESDGEIVLCPYCLENAGWSGTGCEHFLGTLDEMGLMGGDGHEEAESIAGQLSVLLEETWEQDALDRVTANTPAEALEAVLSGAQFWWIDHGIKEVVCLSWSTDGYPLGGLVEALFSPHPDHWDRVERALTGLLEHCERVVNATGKES